MPTIAYPELCHGLVQLDGRGDTKLTDEERKRIIPQLQALAKLSEELHASERRMLDSLTPAQKKWVQDHREALMQASVQPGPPPLDVAIQHLTGVAPPRSMGRR
jgi:hypothetical protein